MGDGPGGPSRRGPVVPVITVLLAVVLLASCGGGSGAVPDPVDADLGGASVLVLGDSLAMQAEPQFRDLADTHGYEVRVIATSGHTPCDGQEALSFALIEFRPDLVVLAYAGNSWLYSDCHGGPDQTIEESVARYRSTLGEMIDDVRAAGSEVGLVGGPVWPANALAEPVFTGIAELAEEHDVAFVDGGRWVTPDRRWIETVPCRSAEPGCEDGRVAVHLVGGTEEHDVHFDCDAPGWRIAGNEPCPVYSAGGYRYARAVDDLVRDVLAGD